MLPLVITVEHADGGTRRYAFADSPVTIGRSRFAELQLSEPFISRWEGTLRFDADEMTYFRLGSTNTTYLNGKPLARCEDDIPLGVESVLTLGELKLRFSREPVAESDLRRKGKRRPTRESTETEIKTLYLDADAPAAPADESPAARAAAERAVESAAATRVLCRVSEGAPPRPPEAEGPRPAAIAPQRCITLGAEGRPRAVSALAETLLEPVAPRPRALRERVDERARLSLVRSDTATGFAARRDAYCRARAALIVDLRAQLEAVPEAERTERLRALLRSEPSLASDPDLQLELQRAGVVAPAEIPALRAWLRAISPEVFPDGTPLDTQLALTRVLGLLEALIQSLAEIHDAQESVRRRWLGRSARRSILQSDNGHLVLSYLLDPTADWNDRLRELEESVRDVVTHELALFRATLEGARTLVSALSPESIASSAGADGTDAAAPPGFWTRLLCRDAGDIGLWRRFLATYGELTDGARYERVFLGRVFSRSYLAAMGRPDAARS